MVTTSDFIEKMNALMPGTGALEPVGGEGVAVIEDVLAEDPVEVTIGDEPQPVEREIMNEPPAEIPAETIPEDDTPELVAQEDDDSDDEAEEEDEEIEEQEIPQRRSGRLAAGVRRPERYRDVLHTVKIKGAQKKIPEEEKRIAEAENAEIELIFDDLKAGQAVQKQDIPEGFKAHNTHIFMVEKFLANGDHDKTKSRIVTHGDEQDSTLYADHSSPTAGIHSIMSCLKIAACNPDFEVAKLDVKGAFIQTEMSGTPVYVQFRGKLKERILRLKPELAEFVGTDGVLCCKLLKALYGCV